MLSARNFVRGALIPHAPSNVHYKADYVPMISPTRQETRQPSGSISTTSSKVAQEAGQPGINNLYLGT